MKKLADIEAKWGPPTQVEQNSDGIIWHYYFYKTNIRMSKGAADDRRGVAGGRGRGNHEHHAGERDRADS